MIKVSLSLFCSLLLFTPAFAQESDECLICHDDESLQEDNDTKRLYVSGEVYGNSIHGGFSCVDCHADLAGEDPSGHGSDLALVNCAECHSEVDEVYRASLHFYARDRGNTKSPNCIDCHGTHDILSAADDGSSTHRGNIVTMCAKCHGSSGLLTDEFIRLPKAVQSYALSVHGRAQDRGIETAAVCSDCHGTHNLKGVLDPESLIHPYNVSATCGKCHNDVRGQYDQSIHGRALKAGIVDSPTCNTCHGEHMVASPFNVGSETYSGKMAMETCGKCHEDSKLIEKYGLASYVVETYSDSYHGWADKLYSEKSATCVACHTAHWVLPARDPRSTVGEGNIVNTCGQCHEDADRDFAASYTHASTSVGANPVSDWIEKIYIILIPLVIGGMLVHNLIIIAFFLRRKKAHEEADGVVTRLDRTQVVQHLLLAITFIGLVITGFALRFPNAVWVQPLTALGMHEAMRSLVHRILACGMLITGVWHLLYVSASRRGRVEFLGMLPRWDDVVDVFENMRYHFGLREDPVRYGRYDYTQKAEYWALIWGTVVMAFTGMVLWFPALAVQYFPPWMVQASEVLHYYEAWLATLAIIVWHFFFAIFHPQVYPMSWTWVTGKMAWKEAEEHHGKWIEEEVSLDVNARREKSGKQRMA